MGNERLSRKLRDKSKRFEMIRTTRKACNGVLTETETKNMKRATSFCAPLTAALFPVGSLACTEKPPAKHA